MGRKADEQEEFRLENPWREIKLSDYEKHMKLDSVAQLQALNEIMKQQFQSYSVKKIMILGIAGGNGLEHIDKSKVEKVYGVDINPAYLEECGKRYMDLSGILELICTDLLQGNRILPHADLLVADLLIEYIGYACFQKVVEAVKPTYVSCVIQINVDETFVSDSPYLHAFERLDEVHHQMEENTLWEMMKKIGYEQEKVSAKLLPNGKKLVRMDFKQ